MAVTAKNSTANRFGPVGSGSIHVLLKRLIAKKKHTTALYANTSSLPDRQPGELIKRHYNSLC